MFRSVGVRRLNYGAGSGKATRDTRAGLAGRAGLSLSFASGLNSSMRAGDSEVRVYMYMCVCTHSDINQTLHRAEFHQAFQKSLNCQRRARLARPGGVGIPPSGPTRPSGHDGTKLTVAAMVKHWLPQVSHRWLPVLSVWRGSCFNNLRYMSRDSSLLVLCSCPSGAFDALFDVVFLFAPPMRSRANRSRSPRFPKFDISTLLAPWSSTVVPWTRIRMIPVAHTLAHFPLS